jgi:hypothetical protein
MTAVGKPPPKIREKESDIPGLFDSKNASSKDDPEVTFAEFDPKYLEHACPISRSINRIKKSQKG